MVPELDGVSAGVDYNLGTQHRIWRRMHIFPHLHLFTVGTCFEDTARPMSISFLLYMTISNSI